MLTLSSYFTPESVRIADELTSKKKAFEQLASLLTPMGQNLTNPIFDALIKREKLGSTGVGNGIAIPHARVDEISNPKLALIRTARIDVGAIDTSPVQLFFGLIVPTGENESHLNLLADLSKCIKEKALKTQLLAADSSQAMYLALLNALDS